MRTPPEIIIPDVESTSYALSSLADQGLLTTRHLADFQDETGLADMAWRVFWNRTALDEAGGDLRSLLRRTHGFVIFIHGWSGAGSMWERLPALICAANPRLIALAPDLNGFGNTPFLAEVPPVERCDPYAMMRVVTYWVEMLGLRSSERARQRRKVITFVGHSMGGAALFYFQEQSWHENEFARCAVAPTLLIDPDLRQGFYRALGVNAWAGKPVDEFKARLTSQVLENLLGSASEVTRAAHLRIFESTPRGTLAQTFYAMSGALAELDVKRWSNFRVVLAHDDQVLNVSRMLRLLDDLGLFANQIQVVKGDHYLLSVGNEHRRISRRNREIVLGEILYLHEICRERQKH